MLIYAHLRKCAGSSVIRAAEMAGLRLPPGHVNGHLPDRSGNALPGMDRMSFGELYRRLQPLVAGGVDLLAIEWDFPRFERFPDDLGLRFFTVFRDPVERLLSNFVYDLRYLSPPPADVDAYMQHPVIWVRPNYYTRFFCALRPDQTVDATHVDYAFKVVSRGFRYAFLDDDLLAFLSQEVGVPINVFPRTNRISLFERLKNRSRLAVSEDDRRRLRAMNAADYRLYDRLLEARRGR